MSEHAICRNCKNARCEEKGSNIWYNWYCTASPREEATDYVTGEKGFKGVNDLGGEYVTNEQFFHCRDINKNGQCEKYIPGAV